MTFLPISTEPERDAPDNSLLERGAVASAVRSGLSLSTSDHPYLDQYNRWVLIPSDPKADVIRWREHRGRPPQVESINRAIWNMSRLRCSAFPALPRIIPEKHPGVVAVSAAWEPEADLGESVTLLDTVQKIRPEDWRDTRDRADDTRNVVIYSELQRRGHESQADRLKGCGRKIVKVSCAHCGEERQIEIETCGQYHLCSRCARIRSVNQQRELAECVRGARQVSGWSWKMLTLTVPTNGEYRRALRQCSQGFARAWRSLLKVPGAGAFRSIEFGPLNGNVHVHVLYYGPWVNRGKLIELWKRETGGIIVDVRQVKDGKGKASRDTVSLGDAIKEVSKYVTKMSEVSATRALDFWEAMKGSHITQRYGFFRGAMRTEREIDALPEPCPKCGHVECYLEIERRAAWSSISTRGP